MENETVRQPLDELMDKLGLSNGDLVAASTEQLTFKMVQKGRKGRRLSRNAQEKILNALLAAKPGLKIRRRELFHYNLEDDAIEKIRNARSLTASGKINFPQFVDHLKDAGLGHYAVDVAAHRITYYGANGEAHVEEGPAVAAASSAGAFDEAGLRAAILDAQKKRIDYLEFLKRAHAAGVTHYEVNIHNRIIAYKGAGASYKEEIPLSNAPAEAPKSQSKPKAEKPKKTAKNTKLVVRKKGSKKTYKSIKQHRVKKRKRFRSF